MRANFQSKATDGITGGSPILDRIINAISDAFARLGDIVTNNKIIPVTFTGAGVDVSVAHGLSSAVTSFDVVDLDAAAIVFRSPTSNPQPRLTIILRASAACRAKVRFE